MLAVSRRQRAARGLQRKLSASVNDWPPNATKIEAHTHSPGLRAGVFHFRRSQMSYATRQRHRELGLDQRTTRKARFVQLVDAFAEELGGTACLNPAELILVKQCATTALACEKLQERMLDEADDAAVDKAIVPLSNALVRLQAALSAAKKRRSEKPRLSTRESIMQHPKLGGIE
jgi:hypothetical protein